MQHWYVIRQLYKQHVDMITMQRDNVIFGQTFDKDRYWDAVDRACLLPDLAVLPDGDLTEVIRYRTLPLDSQS